jgi:hypothetical protein
MNIARTTTPWARERLDDDLRHIIANAQPSEASVDLGYSHGWVCRIYLKDALVGEAYKEATPLLAFRAAQENMAAARAWANQQLVSASHEGNS